MDEILRLADSLVANKFTALVVVVLALMLVTRHLQASVNARRIGMETRIRFLEEQALRSAEVELECVSISAASVTLLSTVGRGGNRRANDEVIDALAERVAKLRWLISQRHDALQAHLDLKSNITREN